MRQNNGKEEIERGKGWVKVFSLFSRKRSFGPSFAGKEKPEKPNKGNVNGSINSNS